MLLLKNTLVNILFVAHLIMVTPLYYGGANNRAYFAEIQKSPDVRQILITEEGIKWLSAVDGQRLVDRNRGN